MSTTSSLDSFRVSKEEHTILTRHFYDRTSVQKAFLHACTHKHPLRKHMLAFWAYELFLSEEFDILGQTLARALVYFSPFCGICDLLQTWNPRSLEFVQRVLGYMTCVPDSVWPATYPPPPDTSLKTHVPCPSKPAEWSHNQRMHLVVAVIRGLRQGHGERVFRFLCGFPPAVALLYLDTSRIPPPLMDAYTATKKGLQHIVCCLGCSWNIPKISVEPAKIPPLKVGTRAARMFGIPPKYIQFPLHPSGFDVLRGSVYWQRVLREYGIRRDESQRTGQLVFETEEALERFYGDQFPEDIPDEWSQEELAKSHIMNI